MFAPWILVGTIQLSDGREVVEEKRVIERELSYSHWIPLPGGRAIRDRYVRYRYEHRFTAAAQIATSPVYLHLARALYSESEWLWDGEEMRSRL
jgi:hypothetical protein